MNVLPLANELPVHFTFKLNQWTEAQKINVFPFISACKAHLTPTRWGREVHPPAGRARPHGRPQSAA